MFESLNPFPRFTDSFKRMPLSSAVRPIIGHPLPKNPSTTMKVHLNSRMSTVRRPYLSGKVCQSRTSTMMNIKEVMIIWMGCIGDTLRGSSNWHCRWTGTTARKKTLWRSWSPDLLGSALALETAWLWGIGWSGSATLRLLCAFEEIIK